MQSDNDRTRDGNFVLSHRDVGKYAALLVLGAALFFVAGYFVGKKRMFQEITQGGDAVFAHKVSASLSRNLPLQSSTLEHEHSHGEASGDFSGEQRRHENGQEHIKESGAPNETNENKSIQAQAKGILCGYATYKAADAYAERLRSRAYGVPINVVQRIGKNKKGATRTWYQVTVGPGEHEHIAEMVRRIARTDKLKGVEVKPCAATSKQHNKGAQ